MLRSNVINLNKVNFTMPFSFAPGLFVVLLLSSTYLRTVSAVQHGSRLFIAKSWGVPINLTCEDRSTRMINVSGISLFKSKHTVEADGLFPGIQAQSQNECLSTFHLANQTLPAECEVTFHGKVLPTDVMVVAVYRCLKPPVLPEEKIYAKASQTGDLELYCGVSQIIDVVDYTLNKSKLSEEEKETTKQRCYLKMFQAELPGQEKEPSIKKPASCIVPRQGKVGELTVKYKCLPAPLKDSGSVPENNARKRLKRRHKRSYHGYLHQKHKFHREKSHQIIV